MLVQFQCLYSRIYLIWHPQDRRSAGLLNIPFIKQYHYLPKFLSLWFFIPEIVNDPIVYTAIITL